MPTTFTGGGLQGPSNIIVPNGWAELRLNTDATVVSAPYGQVFSSIPVIFYFDGNGNVLNPQPSSVSAGLPLPTNPAGAPVAYGQPELSPSGTFYYVNFYNANGARINATPLQWVITGGANSTTNISTLTASSPSGPSYSGAVLLTPAADQTITVDNLLPSAGNTTQSLGDNAAPWNATLYDATIATETVTTSTITTAAITTATIATETVTTANVGTLSAKTFQGAFIVGGDTGYTSISSALAALPSTGGTIWVSDGWTETLSANIVISVDNTVIRFLGTATITQGTYQLVVNGGVYNWAIIGDIPFGNSEGGNYGTAFTYSGTAFAWVIGASSANSGNFRIENINWNCSNTAGSGIDIIRTQFGYIVGCASSGPSGGTGIGMLFDGANNYTGDIVVLNCHITGFGSCMNLGKVSSSGPANAMQIIGGSYEFPQTSGGAGINIQFGGGNQIIGVDIEGTTISGTYGVYFGGDAAYNVVSIYGQGNTYDFYFASGATNNWAQNIGAYGGVHATYDDLGTGNVVYDISANGKVAVTNQSASINAAVLAVNNSAVPHLYNITYYYVVSTAASTGSPASSIQLSIEWNDGVATQSSSGTAYTGNTLGGMESGTFRILLGAGQDVVYSTTYSSTPSSGADVMKYQLFINAVQIY